MAKPARKIATAGVTAPVRRCAGGPSTPAYNEDKHDDVLGAEPYGIGGGPVTHHALAQPLHTGHQHSRGASGSESVFTTPQFGGMRRGTVGW